MTIQVLPFPQVEDSDIGLSPIPQGTILLVIAVQEQLLMRVQMQAIQLIILGARIN